MIRFVIAVLLVVGLGVATGAAQESSKRATSGSSSAVSSPINLNTASLAQLETLPGIGKSTYPRVSAEERIVQESRGLDERARRGGEKLPEAEAAHHCDAGKGRAGRPVTAYGCGRGRLPQRPRPPGGTACSDTLIEILFVFALISILAGINEPNVPDRIAQNRAEPRSRVANGNSVSFRPGRNGPTVALIPVRGALRDRDSL